VGRGAHPAAGSVIRGDGWEEKDVRGRRRGDKRDRYVCTSGPANQSAVIPRHRDHVAARDPV